LGRRHASGFQKARADPRPPDLGHDPRGPPLSLYLDTSALLKLYIEETGSALVHAHVVPGARVATSLVAHVESRAGLARRRRAGDLTSTEYRRAVEQFTDDWELFIRIDVTEPLVREAAGLAERHRLRAYDALHLASALSFAARTDGSMFGSWDDDLDAAAAREGLPLLRAR
jgi:predicted nucleic acid-binding protein